MIINYFIEKITIVENVFYDFNLVNDGEVGVDPRLRNAKSGFIFPAFLPSTADRGCRWAVLVAASKAFTISLARGE